MDILAIRVWTASGNASRSCWIIRRRVASNVEVQDLSTSVLNDENSRAVGRSESRERTPSPEAAFRRAVTWIRSALPSV
jgi:hypothetical protein